MSREAEVEKGKSGEEAADCGPKGFADCCQGMMTAKGSECCGGQMQQMMSRFMGNFQGRQEEPPQSSGEGDKE